MVAPEQTEISEFLDFLVDAIIIVDDKSNILFANKSCAKLFGYKREQLTELSLKDLTKNNAVPDHESKVSNFIGNNSQARAMMTRGIMPCINATGDNFNARISIGNIVFQGEKCGIATIQDYSTVQELIDQLKNESSTDSLTKLFNKRHLEEVIENHTLAIHDSGCLGVAFFDLDGFKGINDNLGHEAGDELLKTISSRLTSHLRSSDICFRIGGDEFLVLFDINDHQEYESEASGLGHKLHDLVTQSTTLQASVNGISNIEVGVSIGIGILPHDGKALSDVISKADKAMYYCKKNKLKYVLVSDSELKLSE